MSTLQDYLGPLRNGYWFDADSRLYHVVVGGHQVGLWSKKRWALRDLRHHLRRDGR